MFMLVLTGVYLTIEIPYSVFLIDFLASDAQGDIEQVEKVGRLLTGVAVAILLVGSVVFPICATRLPVLTTFLIATVVAVPSVKFTYDMLNFVGEETGMRRSGEELKSAFLTNLSKRQLGEKGIKDLVATDTGDWKMFVSYLPALVDDDNGNLYRLTGVSLEQLAKDEAKRLYGEPSDFRAAQFDDALRNLSDSYQSYQVASADFKAALDKVPSHAAQKWDEFRRSVEYRIGRKRNYSARERSAIVSRLKSEGLSFPNGYNPNDEKTFKSIVSKKISSEINNSYEKGVLDTVGAYVPPGLSYSEFVKHKAIQKRLQEVLYLPKASKAISADLSDEDFQNIVFNPSLKGAADNLLMMLKLSAKDFETKSEYSFRGVQSLKAVELPVMAILLSLAGAILHLFKFTNYGLKLVGTSGIRPLRFLNKSLVSASLAALLLGIVAAHVMGQGNRVYSSAISLTTSNPTKIKHHVLHQTLALQPEFSQLGSALAAIGVWPIFKQYTSLQGSRLDTEQVPNE
ncbi:hypothetical protein RI570_20245 [Brucella pseudogrignonensis]|uniref:hypothetical protein n=1 Tax=Brucella pseudogrignonensis TaxID=419475 RepID=UPI0028B86BD5|nr:hypothetical protein [Brucella pseudogrignonensis]MDT6942395.1 hypothetical protein [Brucella pseudogrignonensis]